MIEQEYQEVIGTQRAQKKYCISLLTLGLSIQYFFYTMDQACYLLPNTCYFHLITVFAQKLDPHQLQLLPVKITIGHFFLCYL